MEIITGDLIDLATEGNFDLIAHGCNCQHNFGAGIAKKIAVVFPDAAETDKDTLNPQLGNYSIGYEMKYNLNIINCYTQIWFGKAYGHNDRNKFTEDTPKARYEAMKSCFNKINDQFSGEHIGLPLIGCGLAGLEWHTVKRYMEEYLTDMDVTVVKLPIRKNKPFRKYKKQR